MVSMRAQVSPCHDVACVGGPARVWCVRCGRSFQADDPRLASGPVWQVGRRWAPAQGSEGSAGWVNAAGLRTCADS